MQPTNQHPCQHPDSDETSALVIAAAFGATIEPADRERLLAALVSCPSCRQNLESYSQIAQLLPLSAPLAEPPAYLRERVLAAAQSNSQPGRHSQAGRRSAPPRMARGLRRMLLPGMALLLLLAVSWNLLLQRTLNQQQEARTRYYGVLMAFFGDDDAREFRFKAPSGAYARLWLAPSAQAAGLYVKRLPQLQPGRIYQLWLQRGDQHVSAGTFGVNQEGRAWLVAEQIEGLDSFTAASITDEPEGGSPAPSGTAHLSTTFDKP